MQKIVNVLSHSAVRFTIITGIVIIISFIAYNNFLNAIETNQEKIEITQMMILQPLVRHAENNPCPVSDDEWEEYLINGATLQFLRQKHGLLPKDFVFRPIKRIKETTDTCKK